MLLNHQIEDSEDSAYVVSFWPKKLDRWKELWKQCYYLLLVLPIISEQNYLP